MTLTIFDPARQTTFDATLKRMRIKLGMSVERDTGTAFADLRVAAFNRGVAGELKTALREIAKQGTTGVVLDLRNNPGGELAEAVGAASEFLRGGDVLLEKDSHGAITHDSVRPRGAAPDLPLVVLVDGGTASGAEIVAGALQDAKRASVIGETTFGTGTVLSDFQLSDGSAIQLAVREWFTLPAAAYGTRASFRTFPCLSLRLAELATPDALNGMSTDALAASGDTQMKKALVILGHPWPRGGAGAPRRRARAPGKSVSAAPSPTNDLDCLT